MRLLYIVCLITTAHSFIINLQSTKSNILKAGYVPDGLTEKEWKNIKNTENEAIKKKNFAKTGTTGFKSRSFKSFQKDLENGKNAKNFPMFNAKEKLSKGLIKKKDIPYMQRKNGNWNNSDV